jgi:hypothetical protein
MWSPISAAVANFTTQISQKPSVFLDGPSFLNSVNKHEHKVKGTIEEKKVSWTNKTISNDTRPTCLDLSRGRKKLKLNIKLVEIEKQGESGNWQM